MLKLSSSHSAFWCCNSRCVHTMCMIRSLKFMTKKKKSWAPIWGTACKPDTDCMLWAFQPGCVFNLSSCYVNGGCLSGGKCSSQWWPLSGGSDACHFLVRFWWLGKSPCKFDFVTSRRADQWCHYLVKILHATMAEQQAGQSVQHSFQVPQRLVKTPEDLDKWPTSQVVAEYSQKINYTACAPNRPHPRASGAVGCCACIYSLWSCCKLWFVTMANRGNVPITNEICTLS